MLDEVRAPLRVCSFVAYAPDKPELPTAAGQEARFEAVMAFFEQQKRWPSPRQLSLLARQAEASWLITPPPDPEAPPGAPAR